MILKLLREKEKRNEIDKLLELDETKIQNILIINYYILEIVRGGKNFEEIE